MMILIMGATGQVGGAAARALAARGRKVRVLVRDPARATGLDGCEIVRGSFEEDASMAHALDGVHCVLLAGRDGPDAVAQQSNALKNIRRSGAAHIVKLSAIGAANGSPVELMRDHAVVDEELAAGSVGWTILQPHLYMQNLTRMAGKARSEGKLSAPMGNHRIPLVDTRDVGAAAAAILDDPFGHAGRAYRITGPARYSYDDVADALSRILGRPVTYEPVSPDEFESGLKANGIPDWRAFDLAHIIQAYATEDHAVSSDFRALVGRDANSLATFMADYQDIFLGR